MCGWPFARVLVTGSSMEPTLLAGDQLLVLLRARPRVGGLVVVTPPQRPELLVVKRAVRATPAGWWVEGDNPGASDDSRVFGPVAADAVVARVLWRYWPVGRRESLRRES